MMSLNYIQSYVNHAPEIPETAPRKRRFLEFLGATGLREVRYTSGASRFIERCQIQDGLDHITLFSNRRGTRFLLTEPYRKSLPVVTKGFVITVPIPLSPYCGLFDPDPLALPGTRSYLICDINSYFELDQIDRKLQAAASKCTKRWNEV
jgi:hypothetical protein